MSRSHPELLKLIIEFGDACFDCGEWQLDKNTDVPYETLYAKQQAALHALSVAIEKLEGKDEAFSTPSLEPSYNELMLEKQRRKRR